MPQFTFENKYGSLVIETVEAYRPVKAILSCDIPKEIKFDIETAEKIALITENRGVQSSFNYPEMTELYLVKHNTPFTAAVCKIISLDFNGEKSAQDCVEDEYQMNKHKNIF